MESEKVLVHFKDKEILESILYVHKNDPVEEQIDSIGRGKKEKRGNSEEKRGARTYMIFRVWSGGFDIYRFLVTIGKIE